MIARTVNLLLLQRLRQQPLLEEQQLRPPHQIQTVQPTLLSVDPTTHAEMDFAVVSGDTVVQHQHTVESAARATVAGLTPPLLLRIHPLLPLHCQPRLLLQDSTMTQTTAKTLV